MKTKHTPGPWEVVETSWGIGVNAARNPHGHRLDFPIVNDGQVGGDSRGDEATGGTPEANASLIASAPELLDELLLLCNTLDGEQVSVGVEARVCFARTVIAKATRMPPNAGNKPTRPHMKGGGQFAPP